MAAARKDLSAAHEVHRNSCSVFGRIPGPRVADVGRAGGNGFFRPQSALFSLGGIAYDADRIRERLSFEEHFVALGRCAGDPERLLRVGGDLFGLSPSEVEDADLTEQGLAGKVWLCGEDVFPEVAREIVKGNISMSAWTDLIQMGRSAADAAFALAQGQTPKSNDKVLLDGKEIPGMRIQSRGVDKANLAEFLKMTDWLKPSDVGL